MGLLDLAKSWLYGPPARDYLPPLDRRAVTISGYDQYAGVSYGYAGRNLHTALRAGTLAHGPGATELLRDAHYGDHGNSLVSACLYRRATDFAQVPPEVVAETAPDTFDPRPGHPLVALLKRPNPFVSGLTLRWWTEWALGVHGNAYWRKVRTRHRTRGPVVELWPVSPTMMHPVTYPGSSDFISAYRHYYSANNYEDLPIANVVHFRHGLADEDHRLGCSPFRRAMRDVATDDAVGRLMRALLENGAIPGLGVLLDKDVVMDASQRQEFKDYLRQEFGGDNAGGSVVIQGGNAIERVGFSPSDLDLAPLALLPESRICAIFGVPPQVVGAKVGLEHATYSNYDQAAESYTELTLLPMLRAADETLTYQLLPDFDADPALAVRSNVAGLRALAEDEDALTTRIVAQWEAGLITQDEARSALGYDPLGAAGAVFKAPAPAPEPPAAPEPSERAWGALETRAAGEDRAEALLRASRAQLTDEARRALETYQGGQMRRVVSRVGAGDVA